MLDRRLPERSSGSTKPEPARVHVLIGIPTFRRPDGLRTLLASLERQQDADGLRVEVFAADNDPISQEGAQLCTELAPSYRWPLRSGIVDTPGISDVRNAILDRARNSGAEFVAMLDDDEVAAPNWLRALFDAQRQTDADVVGAPVLYDFAQEPDAGVLRSGYFNPRRWDAGPVPLLDQTGNVLLSCRALERLGWPRFDPDFGLTGGEDKEYFTRLRKQGARFAWAPGALACETVPKARLSEEWIRCRAFRIGNGDMRIAVMHGSRLAVLACAAKAVGALFVVPILTWALPRSMRIRMAAKLSRAHGKLAALRGRRLEEYRERAVANAR